ncbi:MAG: O-antigen ligase family protein [Alphaproteobacteria bacterium]|nr:O-antigen ligase family protein [Alphaproteobacteria bacterium]
MFKVSNGFYSFIAQLYVFLSLLGYQLATTLLLPLSSDAEILSTTVTYPYRAVVFVLAFFLIVASPVNRQVQRQNRMTVLYVVFMFVYFIRILVDIFIRQIYVLPSWRSTVLQYMFIVVIPAILAMLRSVQYIDFQKLSKWMFWGGVVLLVALILNQNTLIQIEYEEMTRGEGNVAMGSLNLGYSCVVVSLIALSVLSGDNRGKLFRRLFVWLVFLVSFVIMLRAASRGPLVTFIAIMLFFVFSRIKNKVFGIFLTLFIILVFWINLSGIIELLGNISPLMEERMLTTLDEGNSSGRDVLAQQAMDLFYQNPIVGKQFVLNDGFYSHNSILDVMIGLGVFGALIWVIIIIMDFKKSYQNILSKSSLMMISFLSMVYIIEGFFSGAMYISAKVAICLIIVFSVNHNEIT